MPATSAGGKLSLRVMAVIGVFVFLNRLATGDMAALLDASWGQPLPWVLLAAGILVSVVLVEAYRRRRANGGQWFVELFSIIGGVVVLNDVLESFLQPALEPVVVPVFEDAGQWGILLLWIFILGTAAWLFPKYRSKYRKNEGAAEGS